MEDNKRICGSPAQNYCLLILSSELPRNRQCFYPYCPLSYLVVIHKSSSLFLPLELPNILRRPEFDQENAIFYTTKTTPAKPNNINKETFDIPGPLAATLS